jgi:hypothetical protein
MAVTTVSSRRGERLFFVTAALCFGAFILIGFWRTYFRAGVFTAPLPSVLVHVHAALMVGWVVLVLCQVGLISSRKVKWHRRLGAAMAFWAAAIVTVGPPTLIYALRRPINGIVGDDGLVLFSDLAMLAAFAFLISRALLHRRNPAEHKRLMLLGTAALMLPALAHWPFDFIQKGPPIGIVGLYFATPVALAIYDLASLRKIHRATILGTAIMATVVGTTLAISSTAWWRSVTVWVQHG